MEGECKVPICAGGETPTGEHTPGRVKAGGAARVAATLMICLAFAAAVFFVVSARNEKPQREKETFDLHHTLRQLSGRGDSIYLEGRYNSAVESSAEWSVDTAHSQGDLTLKDNEIVIPRKGLYFVYSQVSFRINCSSPGAATSGNYPVVHLSHIVELQSLAVSELLYNPILHSLHTACQKLPGGVSKDQGWYATLNTGAVFQLDRGDRLRTVTSPLASVEDGHGRTFFGALAL